MYPLLSNANDIIRSTKSSGKGLGLPIVAQIIRNHGGEISLMKKNTKGTCFRITLPIFKDESEN